MTPSMSLSPPLSVTVALNQVSDPAEVTAGCGFASVMFAPPKLYAMVCDVSEVLARGAFIVTVPVAP